MYVHIMNFLKDMRENLSNSLFFYEKNTAIDWKLRFSIAIFVQMG